MLDGIKNFLLFLNDNWTSIAVILGLIAGLYQKIKIYIKQSDAQKIEAAKVRISAVVLKLISDAEVDYESWNQAGSIKRSQVIQRIFQDYPILSKAVDQEAVIAWIDDQINGSLKELRKIVAQNKVE